MPSLALTCLGFWPLHWAQMNQSAMVAVSNKGPVTQGPQLGPSPHDPNHPLNPRFINKPV
jgi:hypothetical protein